MSEAAAVLTWLLIKRELRKRLPADEWKLWVFPARLLAMVPASPRDLWRGDRDTLIIALPRSGRAIFKARGREMLLRKMCGNSGFNHFFTVAPDEYDQAQALARFGHTFTFLDPDPDPSRITRSRSRLAGVHLPATAKSRQPFLEVPA